VRPHRSPFPHLPPQGITGTVEMLLAEAPAGVERSTNEVCGVNRALPSVSESNTLKTIASSRRMRGK